MKECTQIFSPHTTQETQGFQAMAGMYPRRATLQSCQTRMPAQPSRECGAFQTPPGPVPETHPKVIINAENSQQRMVYILPQCLSPSAKSCFGEYRQCSELLASIGKKLTIVNSFSHMYTPINPHIHGYILPMSVLICIYIHVCMHRDTCRLTHKSLPFPVE